ncbi:uncharacterized protein [Panulirus ornatus]|uniref:uncharacterized protein isoform X1 n=1 Tax=Panulirus ornatus TaxID=150431 RepID=UPI003A88D010
MSGGRRKSRKPQKWEDYVADEEQLATIEKELEKEEKARMQNVGNDEDNVEDVENTVKKRSEGDEIADEAQLEIVIQEDEEEKAKANGITDEENYKVPKDVTLKNQEEEESPQPSVLGGNGKMVGDCTTCGIQLRDWSSAHNHLRFHRLSHVPECIYKVITPLSRRIVCQVCQRSCQNKEVLAYHAYTEHFINHKNAKICPFCSVSFKGMEDFQEHLDIDTVSFRCQMCGVSVNQEHRFYQHTVCCTRKYQQGVTSLPCCICGITSPVNKLYSHLMQHSTLLSLPRHLAHNNKRRAVNPPKPDPPRLQQTCNRPFLCEICDRRFVVYPEFKRHLCSHFKSRSYVCSHCGRSFCQKTTLIVHLYSYHNASPNAEEVIPKEDTAQRSCELCGRSGFLIDELLIRHCILRCSRRNKLQVSFAVTVSNFAKNQNMNFFEILSSSAMHTYLKLGIEAWGTPLYVKEYLEELQTSRNSVGDPLRNYRESIEYTDVQLLEYLDQFEEKNREQDKELEFILNFKSKGVDGSHLEVLPSGENISSKQVDMKSEVRGGLIPATDDFHASSLYTSSSLEALSSHTSSKNCQIDFSRLMQHLRKGSDKRQADEEGGEGGQVDICLVTSTTNTQVTITPAGCHPQDIRPPKIARSVSHKPSVTEIRRIYPGVTVLSDVDFSRIPSLFFEMQEMMSDRVQREMEEAGISPKDLQRLEVEAQLLREAEPFYLEDDPQWQILKFNGIVNGSSKRCSTIPNPAALARIIAETKYNGSTEERKYVMDCPCSGKNIRFVPSRADVARLFMEAQKSAL